MTEPTSEGRQVIWLCRVIVNRPKLMFGLTLGCHLLMCIITGILLAARVDILPIVFNSLPLQNENDVYFLRNEAVSNRFDDLDSDAELEPVQKSQSSAGKIDTRRRRRSSDVMRINLGSLPKISDIAATNLWMKDDEPVVHPSHRFKRDTENTTDDDDKPFERQYRLADLQIIYEVEGANVFTKENLRNIAKFEYGLYNNETFQKHFCQLMEVYNSYQCRPFNSVLRLFDGSIDNDLYDPSFTDIGGTLARAYTHKRHKEVIKYYLGKDAVITNTSVQSNITRTFMFYGRPHAENLHQWEDSYRDDLSTWRKWAFDDLVPKLKNHHKNGLSNISLVFTSNRLYFEQAFRQVFYDWYWLMGSVLFIFSFMWFQSSSLWITGWGLFSVVTCFVSGNLVYNLVLDYKFFGIFNVLAIFIVLGVGADDIFVFIDSWRLLEGKGYTLEERLSECYRRAAGTMLVTSLTTMVAFFVSGFSPLLSVSSFGVFAGVTIFVNYISVIVYFPTVVITHHLYFEKNACCCCATCCCSKPSAVDDEMEFEDGETDVPRNKSTENLQKTTEVKTKRRSKVAVVSDFLGGPFFNFVTHKVVKWIIVGLSLALTGGAIYFCTTLESDNTSNFRIFGPDNVFEIASRKVTHAFMENSGDSKVTVDVYWGLGPQDRAECLPRRWDTFNPCEGSTVWVDEFDLNSEENQLALMKFCQDMRNISGEAKETLKIASDPDHPQQNHVDCFIEDMDKFFKSDIKALSPSLVNVSLSVPITRDKLRALITASPEVFRNDAMDYISRPFEIAYEYWITKGHSTLDYDDDQRDVISARRRYVGLRKIGRTNLHRDHATTFVSEIYQKKMKFAGIKVTTSQTSRALFLEKGLQLMRLWEQFITQKMKTMPESLNHGWQNTGRWSWFTVQETLAQQGVLGIVIGLALSFVIIFLGTLNIIIAILATLVLGSVSAFVIAVIPIGGWKLGLLESLNLCLVVGLSVDYIVHLAEAYHLSTAVTRQERTREALMKVGVSIISGAFTTLGASFFMFFAEILFFLQFGMFIFCTIGLSMVMSLFLFSALLSTLGPEGNQGSIKPWVDKLQQWVCGCKPRKVNNQTAHFHNEAYENENEATA